MIYWDLYSVFSNPCLLEFWIYLEIILESGSISFSREKILNVVAFHAGSEYFTWLFWYHNVTRCISSNTLSDRIRILEHPVGRLILSHSWDIYVNLTVDMSVCLWNQSWIILKIMTAYFAYRSYTYIEYIFGMKLLTYAL